MASSSKSDGGLTNSSASMSNEMGPEGPGRAMEARGYPCTVITLCVASRLMNV
jgi:hypothetical protein